MAATVWLLGCLFAPAQPVPRDPAGPPRAAPRRADWVVSPRPARNQEFVYRGSYTETAGTRRVEFQRGYRLEARFFALDVSPRGTELAAMTLLYTREASAARPAARAPGAVTASSVCLERVTLDAQGRLSADPGVSLAPPLEGAPALEVGAFVELPRGRLALNQGWETAEAGRPLVAWRVAGTESVAGQNCLKVVGVQQSDDWEQPRADRSAWRRTEVVWVGPRDGVTARLERTVEQRDPARREVARRSVTRYDLESVVQYPEAMAAERRAEIVLAWKLRQEARPLLADPARNAHSLHGLARRLATQLEGQAATPYRPCVVQLRQLLEAAGRGEVVRLTSLTEPAEGVPGPATVGQAAPDFVASEVAGTGSGRLGKWKGRPILLVFYDPESFTAGELLRFAQGVHERWGKHLTVVGLCVRDERERAVRQRDELKLTFPLLFGSGLRISYKVETTPKLVVVDAAGVVRGGYFGWGRETPNEVLAELRSCLAGR